MNNVQQLLYKVSEAYNIDFDELIDKFSEEKKIKSINSIDPMNNIQNDKKKTINFFDQKKITTNMNIYENKSLTPKQPRKRIVNDTIKTYKFTYKNEFYLVDDHNNVYTFDIEKPKIIGIKLIDNSIKFY